MSVRRRIAVVTAVGVLPLVPVGPFEVPAAAHGSMGNPVSRVAQCYAEGPESPRSAACGAAVAAGGTQALYDWNGVRIGDANGRHRALIADGRLCSAGNSEFTGLDLPRTDWPATGVHSGPYTFRYRVTAPHKGTFTVYLTKPGYDPSKPLAWADLDLAHPVATATDPVASGGFYTFSGSLPRRSGRQLLYAIWQRSDSPEAFYSCSDVVFGGSGAAGTGKGTAPLPSASAPSERQIEAGAGKSAVGHHGHGGDGVDTPAASAPERTAQVERKASPSAAAGRSDTAVNGAEGTAQQLAETGGGASTSYQAIGGAGALALGAAALFASVRRRASRGARRGR
ncbi:lytic polysaccharide monooxygenase auxiliary activity family 9 protein [Streptomyces glomeratus]|uniref:Carbohydrate-binding protein CbpC n=1 Tax=Streptomyces glomeratus TaxID=284452 RepID=A0ABP6KVG9_9ACTN|nr:lytic polysaccharide monooxygenase [Streptomyces glomeratus]MCF1510589.1 lytic polysaccharide monooxygenase [Streptomyces glomeratus]